ncbi:MAG TPA: hypothetical protein VH591_21470 [Ktedonobacterales bacterium]
MFRTSMIARKRTRSVLWLLPLLSVTLAILACGISLGSHVGYHPPPVTHLPASQLRLAIQITGQYEHYGGSSGAPTVQISVRITEGTNPSESSLPDKATLTCNGVDIKRNAYGFSPPCPRQPPGGAYRLVYTDEHGAKTTVVIPVPAGTFAILSPQDGATVPIPTNGVLPVRFTIPTAPANGNVAVDNVTAACSVSDAQPCGAVYTNLRPTGTATPGQDFGVATVAPLAAKFGNATPLPGKTPTGGPIPALPPTPTPGATQTPTTPSPTPTVVVTQNGNTGTILLTGDYSEFQPARGFLSMAVEAQVTPDPGDFAFVAVGYSDTLHTQFTWTR